MANFTGWNGKHAEVMLEESFGALKVSVGVTEGKDCWWSHDTVMVTRVNTKAEVEAWVRAHTPAEMRAAKAATGKCWLFRVPE